MVMTYRPILAGLGTLALSASLASPARTAHPAPARPEGLADIHMANPRVGWATTGVHILRTTDGGVRWMDVTPQVRAVVAAGQPFPWAPRAQFLDATRAWVAQPVPAGPVPLWRTADGGRTWQAGGTLPAQYAASAFQLRFSDPRHGWALIEGGGMNSNALALFQTSDGGRRWVAVATRPPISGLLGFRTATTGWGTDEHTGGVPAGPAGAHTIYATQDGGRTWQAQALPSPIGYVGSVASFGGGPSFATPRDGVLPVTLFFQDGQRASALVLYATHDGGRTWRPTTPLRGGSDATAGVLDGHIGWALDGRAAYLTRDGGRHWQAIRSNVSLTYAYPVDVVTPRVVFALAGRFTAQGGRTTLLKTLDGGRTWALAQPLLLRRTG